MTFLGLDFETSARYANIAVICLAALGTLVGAFAYRWSNEAQALKDEKAAVADKTLSELQEARKPRVLTPDQIARLTTALRSMTDRGEVAIGALSGDVEGASLAGQFQSAFRDAGWPTVTSMMLGVAGTGAAFIVADVATAPDWVRNVVGVFAANGVPLNLQADANLIGHAQGKPLLLAILTKP